MMIGFFDVVAADEQRIHSQMEAYTLLEKLGFPLNPKRALCSTLDAVEAFIAEWQDQAA